MTVVLLENCYAKPLYCKAGAAALCLKGRQAFVREDRGPQCHAEPHACSGGILHTILAVWQLHVHAMECSKVETLSGWTASAAWQLHT